MLEEVSHYGLSAWTNKALNLHDYQYNGPDMAISKYRNREEAAAAILELVKEIMRRIEELKPKIKWNSELENALKALQN